MLYTTINSFDEICHHARELCKGGTVYNLMLANEFDAALIKSPFVDLHRKEASFWQAANPPSHLPFSHGQYFHGEPGIKHVISELKSKSSSRRALLSLLDMNTLIGSGDRAIPSFMIAQFGFEHDCLYVTEYFRALEVGHFLPINLAELSLMVDRITREVARPRVIRLLLVAFQAHLTNDFHCLERAPLDIASGAEIGVAVTTCDIPLLLSWLEGKRRYESEVLTQGLADMAEAVKLNGVKYQPLVYAELNSALTSLESVKQLRASCSDERRIDAEFQQYVRHIEAAMRGLRGHANGA